MSADMLRRAAALMRERASTASSGPWSPAAVDGMGYAVHHGEHDTIALYAGRSDARHIASWHPAVALAVADWLESMISLAEDEAGCAECPICEAVNAAVAVARAYLGESA